MAADAERKTQEQLEEVSVNLEVARATIGELVIRAGVGNERIPITRHGKPIAAVIGMKDLDRLLALDATESAT